MPKPDIGIPSLEANVILTVWLAPMTTEMAPVEGVATTKLSVPERELLPLNPTVLPVLPVPLAVPAVLPVVTAAAPRLLS
jgi:hypothetical protein